MAKDSQAIGSHHQHSENSRTVEEKRELLDDKHYAIDIDDVHDDHYNADDDDVIDEDYSENEVVIDNDVDNDFNDVQFFSSE